MDYEFRKENEIDVLSVQGNVLTGIHNTEIIDKVTDMIRSGSRKMIVQLGESRFINSNGLNLLLNILTKYRKAGGEVVLANVSDELRKLLEMTKLNSVFIDRANLDESMTYLNKLD